MMRAGPTDKMVFEQRLEVIEHGKGVPGRGTVGIKARSQELPWCSKRRSRVRRESEEEM